MKLESCSAKKTLFPGRWLLNSEYVLGIDEAGRGSLIGPMMVAGVVLSESSLKELGQNGVTDSKALSPETRRDLAILIADKAKWFSIVEVPPVLIDSHNINKLTAKAIMLIIKRACRFVSLKRIVSDMVKGVKIPPVKCGYTKTRVTMVEKAELKFIEVAAASILAKVARDNVLEYLREQYGVAGSGYPSDPATLNWVRENRGKIPRDIIRLKWSTVKKINRP